MMDSLSIALIGMGSVLGAGLGIGIGGIGPAIGEGEAAKQALASMAQQPDEANNIRSTMFVAMAMIESTAIYALLISMILIFFNPFWTYAIANAAK